MSALRSIIVRWADARIAEMLAAPRMWGSDEAVELQVLQLHEIRALALRPDHELEEPRGVLERYQAFLRQRFPNAPPAPLFALVEHLEGTVFAKTLEEFSSALRKSTRAEDPFEHAAVALRLTFDPVKSPSMSALSGYYEEFRRATRSGARDRPGSGRVRKEIEHATDFSLDDIVYSPPNGVPGQVILKLGHQNGQANFLADDRVRETLTTFLTIGEWAGGKDAVSELRVDDAETRTRAAVQVRRLLPRGAIKSVSFGGKLVSRTVPVTLRAEYEARILEVVSELTPPEPFDMTDEIRAIDLDRGVLLLGKARIPCYLRPELLQSIAQVGVSARVVGQRYRQLKGPAFVLADDAEAGERPADDAT
jgi:hypothetical protein